MFAASSNEAVSMLEALEHGVHGVVLETDSATEVGHVLQVQQLSLLLAYGG